MNRPLVFFTFLLMIGGLGGLFAQTEQAPQTDAVETGQLTQSGDAPEILSLRNNQYYLESVRLSALAQSAYEEGDYDTASAYAEESLHYANLSDEYAAIETMAAAKSRLDRAAASGEILERFPDEYAQAGAEYEQGQEAMDAEDWYEVINAVNRAFAALKGKILPGRYTVRAWSDFKDCLWNIAAKPFVYGDPHQWRLLYNANRSKLADPDNPNVIEPGVALDIPPIKGEFRLGMWDEQVEYEPLR